MTTNDGGEMLITQLAFTIPGKPVGKERPRVTRKGTYTPQTTREYEAAVRQAFLDACLISAMNSGRRFDKDRVRRATVTVCANFRVPPSWSKAKQSQAYNTFCTRKPDADNIGKVICDALNGVAYPDDACVVSLTVDKYWCGKGEDACVEVTLELWQ